MTNYPTQLDEIDQWLYNNFGIVAGACSSTENLRYNTAKMIAESLWPKCKDSLHIQEMCKENGDSFTDEEWEKALDSEVLNAYSFLNKDKIMLATVKGIARHFANWQKEQDKETIELAEDHAMLAGMVKKEEEMKEKALELTVYLDDDGYPCIPEIVLFDFDKNQPTAKEGDKVKVYIFKN